MELDQKSTKPLDQIVDVVRRIFVTEPDEISVEKWCPYCHMTRTEPMIGRATRWCHFCGQPYVPIRRCRK